MSTCSTGESLSRPDQLKALSDCTSSRCLGSWKRLGFLFRIGHDGSDCRKPAEDPANLRPSKQHKPALGIRSFMSWKELQKSDRTGDKSSPVKDPRMEFPAMPARGILQHGSARLNGCSGSCERSDRCTEDLRIWASSHTPHLNFDGTEVPFCSTSSGKSCSPQSSEQWLWSLLCFVGL